MKTKRFRDLMQKTMSAEEIAEAERRARAELLELSLGEMRKMVGATQVAVAEKLEKAQSEISALERRDDYFLSTLKRYIEALGGELEVIARFGDRSVRLRGV